MAMNPTAAIRTRGEGSSPRPAELRKFVDGGGTHPGFRFLRAWWDGDGPRAGIAEDIGKKLRPGDDPAFGQAARYEVLLPASASSDYMSVDHLLSRYDALLPTFENTAYAQVTIDLDTSEPLHVGYERVRSYARLFTDQDLAVILVLHVPAMALSANAPHCHLIIPGRFLTAHGFGPAARETCSDFGNRLAWEAWQDHLNGPAGPSSLKDRP